MMYTSIPHATMFPSPPKGIRRIHSNHHHNPTHEPIHEHRYRYPYRFLYYALAHGIYKEIHRKNIIPLKPIKGFMVLNKYIIFLKNKYHSIVYHA